MRHQSSTRHFNRDTKARQALILSLVTNLAQRGEIIVTKPMAKEAARHMDKLIVKAKQGDVASRRVLHTFFGKRALVNLFVDQIAPAMGDRTSGFTTISFFGTRRGDNAQLYSLKFVTEIPAQPERTKSKFPEKKVATSPAAKKSSAGTPKTASKPAAPAKSAAKTAEKKEK